LAPLEVEASAIGNGSPNIEVFALLLLPGFENTAGVEVTIDCEELFSCLLTWSIVRSSSCGK